jgi:hypothetical protein
VSTLLLEHPANPGRVGSSLDSHAHGLLLRSEASPESLGCGAQPAFLDHLAAYCVDEAQLGVPVAEVQSGCHVWLVFASITHGPILLSIGPPARESPYSICRPSKGTAYGGSAFSSHLPRTPYTRSSEKAPQANVRFCEFAPLDHCPRSVRHRSGSWATGCFETHVSTKDTTADKRATVVISRLPLILSRTSYSVSDWQTVSRQTLRSIVCPSNYIIEMQPTGHLERVPRRAPKLLMRWRMPSPT